MDKKERKIVRDCWSHPKISIKSYLCLFYLFSYSFNNLLYMMLKKLVVHLGNYRVIDELIDM